MKLKEFFSDDYLLWEAFVLSVVLHSLLFHAGAWSIHVQQKHTVEIDITNRGHIGMPGHAQQALAPAAPKPVSRRKEWIKPVPNQKIEPAPIPTRPAAPVPEEPPPATPTTATGNATGEYGIGTGDGGTNVLSRIPQLLNLSDLRAILKRYYPEQAREDHREGTVVLDMHIDTDGHVTAVDLVQSAGADFDEAAKKSAMLLRFTPAFLGSQRVNVKMRQAIQFKLEQ